MGPIFTLLPFGFQNIQEIVSTPGNLLLIFILSSSHYNNESFRKCLTSKISHQAQRCEQITVLLAVSFAHSTNVVFYTRLWKSFS